MSQADSPRVCNPTGMCDGTNEFTFCYPDGSIGSYGFETDWVIPGPVPT